jgi:hypothetical protein
MNDRQRTGDIGLFYACFRLSRLGWHAMPTIRNARGADIFIVSSEGKKFGIQVKTLSGEADVFVGKNFADPCVDFWIVLTNARKNERPNACIIPAEDIRNGVAACEKGVNSNDNLVYSDRPKADGDITCYLNRKYLREAAHSYAEAWESIR